MTEKYTLNSTKNYHTGSLQTLGWELTICNALYPEGTPVRKVLTRDEPFGRLLYDYLSKFVPMENVSRVLEVGGGYGYLMKDFLEKHGSLTACMIDVSPVLLEKQRETLNAFSDENLGDFPSLINLRTEIFDRQIDDNDPVLKWVKELFAKYSLEKPQGETFNLNVGAIEALEKLCSAKIPYIYIGEHSCEASVSGEMRSLFQINSTGNPERINLAGHDEYTIKFSFLEKVGAFHGYESFRGPFADFIPVTLTDEARYALMYGGHYSDEAEMITQFVEDLYKYEYLILRKSKGAP